MEKNTKAALDIDRTPMSLRVNERQQRQATGGVPPTLYRAEQTDEVVIVSTATGEVLGLKEGTATIVATDQGQGRVSYPVDVKRSSGEREEFDYPDGRVETPLIVATGRFVSDLSFPYGRLPRIVNKQMIWKGRGFDLPWLGNGGGGLGQDVPILELSKRRSSVIFEYDAKVSTTVYMYGAGQADTYTETLTGRGTFSFDRTPVSHISFVCANDGEIWIDNMEFGPFA